MTVYIIDLEAVPTRYTGEWKTHVPQLLQQSGLDVCVIDGPEDIPAATTPGAFLNFGGTNIYKSVQVEKISRLICSGSIKDGDYFLFTDAWHPGIINLKYMASLLGIKIKIGGCWHAGSYDSQDFLGRLIGDADWVRHAEQSFFYALDHNYFATYFHINMFNDVFSKTADKEWLDRSLTTSKIVRTGWPMEYLMPILKSGNQVKKRDRILFPHRIAPEKQLEIFNALSEMMPQYEWVVCQDKQLTKEEYHALLNESKMVFSANLQETLGIGCFEALCVGAMPLVPNRLSYKEMYSETFLYPSYWTDSIKSFNIHKHDLANRITNMMESFDDPIMKLAIDTDMRYINDEFFSAADMIKVISQSV